MHDGADTDRPSDNTSDVEQRRREAWAALGVTAPEWEDDRDAPPVDEHLLRLLARDAIAPRDHSVYELILKYRSWAEGYARILAEEFRKRIT